MATRTKTLWYATALAADVTDAVTTNLTQITLYVDQNRTFKSCLVWLGYADICTLTGATLGEHRCGMQLGASGYTTVTETDDITNSGENMAGAIGPFDFTTLFTNSFGSGASQTCDIQVYFDQTTGTTLGARNISALIAITFEYPDTNATAYATAIVPLESPVGACPTSETELGTNQIPQLTGSGGILENVSSVTVRQQFFLVEGNGATAAGTTDFTVNVRIDTGTTHTFGVTERALGSDCYHWFMHIESPAAGSTHAFKLWTATVGAMNMAVVTMYVTYEFTVSGTTEFLNSILIPFELLSPIGGTASTNASRFQRKFFINEPTTITLKQSAFRLYWVSGAGNLGGLNARAGSQSYRGYTSNTSQMCGCECLQQRIDSGGAQGAGVTVARGENTITVDVYRTDTTDLGWNCSGLIVLNYKSGIATDGIGAHSHTIVQLFSQWDAALSTLGTYTPTAIAIPESNYRIVAVGLWVNHWDAAQYNGIGISAQTLAGEGKAAGYEDVYCDVQLKDAERGCIFMFPSMRDIFKRYPQDPDSDRLDIESSRSYRYTNVFTCARGIVFILSYHSIYWTRTGTISGYAGTGGSISVDIKRTDTGEKLCTVTTSAGGGYSFIDYHDTLNKSADAQEDSTHQGRSATSTT